MWRCYLLLENELSVLALFAGHSCGLNAVRHRQDQQLRKLLGDDYQRRHRERRLQLLPFGTTAPLTRLQKLLIASAPAAMRVKPVYQLDAGYLSPQQSTQLRGVLVPGAMNVLHQYIKVRPTGLLPAAGVCAGLHGTQLAAAFQHVLVLVSCLFQGALDLQTWLHVCIDSVACWQPWFSIGRRGGVVPGTAVSEVACCGWHPVHATIQTLQLAGALHHPGMMH
jgi:hypothetical protein